MFDKKKFLSDLRAIQNTTFKSNIIAAKWREAGLSSCNNQSVLCKLGVHKRAETSELHLSNSTAEPLDIATTPCTTEYFKLQLSDLKCCKLDLSPTLNLLCGAEI